MREHLNPQARATADLLIERNVAAVRAAVADVRLPEPACALCLIPPHDEEMDDDGVGFYRVGDFGIQIPSRRSRALAAADELADARVRLWFIEEFEMYYEPVPGLDDDEFRTAERVLFEQAPDDLDPDEHGRAEWERIDCYWVFAEVCRALNATPPLASVTDDFVAFFHDSDFNPAVEELVPAIAPPERVRLLRGRGLLGEPLKDPLEDMKDE